VRVHDVGRLFAPCQRELVAEVAHERGQVFFRQLAGRPSWHVDDVDTWGERYPGGLACRRAPRVDGYLMPTSCLGLG
jgi:hypothetical protein